jgi:hypothetical protein
VPGRGVNEMGLTRSGYLKEMGIDVWTSRSAVASQVVAEAETAIKPAGSQAGLSGQAAVKKVEKAEKVKTDAPVQTADAGAGKEIPEFMLALFHYETMGICLSLSAESDLPGRFCDDVARAMGGNIESVRYQLLKWPMLSTSGIDQSINAAREVVTQKFRQMPSRVLVFGEDVGDYYNPLRDLSPLSVGAVGAQTFLMVPSLKDLLGSGSAKRELMLAMHHWRSGEMS